MSGGFDLAELSIRIDTSDAKEAVTTLGGVEAAAEKTERKTTGLETATEALSKAFAQATRSLGNTTKALADIRSATSHLSVLEQSAAKIQTAFTATATATGALEAQLMSLGGAAGKLQAALADTSALSRFLGHVEALNQRFGQMGKEKEGAADALRKVKDEAAKAEPPVTRFADGMRTLAGQFLGVAAAGAAIKSATEEALRFSTAMAQVSTVLEQDQLGMMVSLTAKVKELGNQFGRTPTDQAGALYEILSAGASDAAKATELLTVSNKLAIGGVTDVRTAADGLTGVMASYGSQLRNVTQAADMMFVSAADGKTSIEDLSRFIGRVAPIASQTGVSLAELLAATGALTKNNIQTSTSMEGLRAIIAAVAKPSHEAAKLADALGLEFSVTALKARGLAGFLEEVNQKTHGSAEEMAMLFGGVEALLPVMTLTGTASADFAASLKHMQDSAGRTEAAFQKMASTPQFALDQLRARFAELQGEVGSDILSAAEPGIRALTENFDTATNAVKLFGEALVVVAAMRGAAWAQEWVKGLVSKATALNQARESATNAALAEAKYTRSADESRIAALRSAQAMLEKKYAALQASAAVEGGLMSATKKATLASTELALAKVKEAAAIEGASVAARAGKAALDFMGGPIGIITGALTLAVAAFHELGQAADEAREKTRQFAQESGTNASRGSQIVVELIKETRALQDQSRAMAAFNIAKAEMATLGGNYQDLLTDEVDTVKELAAVYEKLTREDLGKAQEEVKRLTKEVKDKQNLIMTVNYRWGLADAKDFTRARKDPRFAPQIEEKLVPLEKDLAAQQQRVADIEKGLQRLKEARSEEARAGAAAANEASAHSKESLKEAAQEEKAREKLLKRQEQWLMNLEEEARTLGKTKDEAKQLSDEYRSLKDPKMVARADAAIAQLEALRKQKEETERVKKAEEERARVLQGLNRELGNQDTEKYAQAQKVLREELDAGRLKAAEFEAAMKKARAMWTPEGKSEAALKTEMDQLAKQLNPTAELQKRLEMVKQLFADGRITAEQYRQEVERLQDQLHGGFSYTKEIVGTATQHMADAFANFVTTGRLEFSSLVDGILKDLARLAAQKAFMALVNLGMDALSGSVSSGSGSTLVGGADMSSTYSFMLGGAHAAGGPVRASQAHLVGELGPELFIPSSSGRIVPNEALGGGDVNQTLYITVNADGSSQVSASGEGGRAEAERLGRRLADAVRKVMREEMAPGGMTYTFVRGR
ncbi:phage tail tape measure protein [Corallococcus sp. AB030]|uniref:phage tail tape measure protein n=1 Tax=Corallococcus sp. AB030 TaxID=2316716 RepID=UPI000ECB9B50|nr:phage tail tape measure protein [Corallococcus sp. AB030]RKI09708.1 phage tail tape measure protein [Corallococcus sp. AB030]